MVAVGTTHRARQRQRPGGLALAMGWSAPDAKGVARGQAGRRHSRGLRLRPPSDGARNRVRATRGRAVAELAYEVVAPAIGRPYSREPAGVRVARGDEAERQSPGDGDWNRAIHGRAVAELAFEVVAPAIGRPRAREPAGVLAARGE